MPCFPFFLSRSFFQVKNVLKFLGQGCRVDRPHYYTSKKMSVPEALQAGLRVARTQVVVGSFDTLILKEERELWRGMGKWVVTLPSLRWALDPETRQASLYANEDIAAGSMITEYGGSVVSETQLQAYRELCLSDPEAAEEWGRHIRVFSDGGTAQASLAVKAPAPPGLYALTHTHIGTHKEPYLYTLNPLPNPSRDPMFCTVDPNSRRSA